MCRLMNLPHQMVRKVSGACQRDQAAPFMPIRLSDRAVWVFFAPAQSRKIYEKYFLIRTWPVRFNLYDSAMEVKGGESVRINDRQQQIINLLCQRRSDTVQNLAAELGVCERTIRRDIEELTLTHPLETVRGRYGGGVKMADWYFQDRPKLSPKQTALLKRLAVGLHGEDLDEMNQILARFAS